MMKNGYLSDNDVVGSQRYMDANGNISVGTVINLRKINFGGLQLDNVRASVIHNQKAPLLLGQSVLARLGKIEIDNGKQILLIKSRH
jgi:predicted aspartyl protease